MNELSSLGAANASFGIDLYKIMAAEAGNVTVAPASISTALAMTYAGARGTTATEMAAALRFDKLPTHAPDSAEFHKQFGSLLSALGDGDAVELSVANRLWGQKDIAFIDAFVAQTRTDYGAEMARVDFRTKSEEIRKTINAWIAEQTKNKIPELIRP
ncbi:MAG: serpin family protein, partial [Myxococcota bacterium]